MIGTVVLFILFLLFLQWTVEYVLKSRGRVCTDCGNFFNKQGWLLGYPSPPDSCPECGKDVPHPTEQYRLDRSHRGDAAPAPSYATPSISSTSSAS